MAGGAGPGVGEVAATVGAAAFFAGEGGAGHQLGDLVDVAEFGFGAAGGGAGGLAGLGEAVEGFVEAFGAAEEAGAAPGERAEFGLGDAGDDEGRRGRAGAEGAGFAAHGEAGASAIDEAFEQGITGEAIGSMDAGAGDFAGGVEAGDGGLSIQTGGDAAHGVVGGGEDGAGLAVEVDAVSEAGGVDARETIFDEIGAAAGEVEEDVGGAVAFHFGDDGAGDDVARGEVAEGVVAFHEAFAAEVEEAGAFTAEGFGEEEAGRAGDVEGGGVELDEFEVADGGAGAPGHGDAVAGGDIGISGVLEDAAETAGSEQDGAGAEFDAAGVAFVESESAGDGAVGVEEEVGDGGEAEESDAGDGDGFVVEGAGDLAAGGIAVGVKHAGARVGAFAGEKKLGAIAVELDAPLDEFLNASGAFLDEGVDGFGRAESIAGGEGVGFVEADLVVVAEGDGDTALGVGGRRFFESILGDDEDAAEGGEVDGGPHTGDARADDEEIRFEMLWPVVDTHHGTTKICLPLPCRHRRKAMKPLWNGARCGACASMCPPAPARSSW